MLQGRVSQLEGELRSSRKAAKESAKEKDMEIARLRELVDSLGQARQLQENRPTSHWGGGAVASNEEEEEEEEARQTSERALFEEYVETRRGQMSESWEDGAREEEVGEVREKMSVRETHTHRIPTGSNEDGSSYGAPLVDNTLSDANHHQEPPSRPKVRPPSAKVSSGGALRKKPASPEPPPPAIMAAPRGRAKREVTDSLEYLASRVKSGHITKQTPLQLAIEFCGKSSFSLRHNEEKYNVLSQQLVTLAYKHLRDRWVTVLKNAEPVDDKGTTKQPRLGSFEVELLWIDQDGSPRRTVLHSKLKTRVFPNVNRVIEELTDALNSAQLIADSDE